MTTKELQQWKQKYNEYLMRHFKAVVLDEQNYFKEKQNFEKWQPKYQEVINELNYILSLFDAENIKYTFDEMTGGFEDA